MSIAFGTGGTECDLAGESRTSFTSGEKVRMVVSFDPELVAGTIVTFRLWRDEKELEAYRDSLTLDEAAPCIYSTFPGGPGIAGHYRQEIEVEADALPPISGEFDVTE